MRVLLFFSFSLLSFLIKAKNVDTIYKGCSDSFIYTVIVKKNGKLYSYFTIKDSTTELIIQNPNVTDFLKDETTSFTYLSSNCSDIFTMTASLYFYQEKPLQVFSKDTTNHALYLIVLSKSGELIYIDKYQFELESTYCGNSTGKYYVLTSITKVFSKTK